MAHSHSTAKRGVAARVGGLIVVTTAGLTVVLLGLLAFATGDTAGIADRLPFYVLGAAGTFVAAVVGLEGRRLDPRQVIATAAAVGVAALVVLSLGGEGLVYAARHPEQALASERILYLLAAGLTATGLGYWVFNHWRALAPTVR
ncbi:MAG: hypothetical protein ABEH77_08600 [Halobacteriaceae archaeon]